MEQLRLHDGSRIAIIGGGPAGSFFAHFATKLARQKGIRITVTILDGKNFLRQGPPGCNMCAGVISEPLLARLEEEGLHLPEGRVQRGIDAYHVHTADTSLLLLHPEGKKGAIRTVYRGSGPRFWPEADDVSFDDFLLGHVKRRGVEVIEQVVDAILLSQDPRARIRLLYGSPDTPTELEADLVVGAFGLNTSLLRKIVSLGFGYQPPRSIRAFQAELRLGQDHIRTHLGNRIHVFSLGLPDIRFASLTPKKEHATVSIIGYRDATVVELRELLAHPAVRGLLPARDLLAERYCRCRPRIGITPAKTPYRDRMVMVGDANCSRYFKNGIESAFVTAQLAAEAAFESGISASAFRKAYARRVRQTLVRDNTYGRLLFRIHGIASRHGLLAQTYAQVARSQQRGRLAALLARKILWDMFTGNVPYRTILAHGLNPRLQARLTLATLNLMAGRIRSRAKGRGQLEPVEPRKSEK